MLVTSQSFDLTQKNLFGTLAIGATLHLADTTFDPRRIVELIQANRITHINLSPSAFYALIDENHAQQLGTLRRVVLGGEPIQLAQLQRLSQPRPNSSIATAPLSAAT